MNFGEYCIKKKIDAENFKKSEPEKWESFSKIFEQVSENSFTQQKKFLLNDLRKSYPYLEKEIEKGSQKEIGARSSEIEKKPVSAKPKLKPTIVKKENESVKEEESGDPSLKSREENKSVNKPTSAKPKIKPIIKPKVKKENDSEKEEEKKSESEHGQENKEKPSTGVSGALKPKIKPLIKIKK